MTHPWITDDIKNAYAAELARHPGDPLIAATKCVPNGDWGMACELMAQCNDDLGFKDRQRDVVADLGAAHFVPSKELVIFEILSVARTAEAPDTRLKAYELAAKMNGWIEKGGGSNVNVQVNNQRVMVVTRHTTIEDFEAAAKAQQAKLIVDATRPRETADT